MATGNKNPGNFSNDREKATEAGKKGGQSLSGNIEPPAPTANFSFIPFTGI